MREAPQKDKARIKAQIEGLTEERDLYKQALAKIEAGAKRLRGLKQGAKLEGDSAKGSTYEKFALGGQRIADIAAVTGKKVKRTRKNALLQAREETTGELDKPAEEAALRMGDAHQDKLDKKSEKRVEKERKRELQQLAKDTAKENLALQKEQQLQELTSALLAAGPSDLTPEGAYAIAQGLAKGSKKALKELDKGTRENLGKTPDLQKLVPPAVYKNLLTPAATDMVLQVGSNGVKFAQRVDPGDVGVFSKPGGALSKAGGSSGVTNVYHLYNDGPGVLAAITKAQQAGVLRYT